jgi:hypothetical protein
VELEQVASEAENDLRHTLDDIEVQRGPQVPQQAARVVRNAMLGGTLTG